MPQDIQLTSPLVEPLLKVDVKTALRIDATDSDAVVDGLIEAICRLPSSRRSF